MSEYADKFNRMAASKLAFSLLGLAHLSKVGGWISETDLTEHIEGSSGRGSPRAKALLREFAARGLLRMEQKGRVRRYHVPAELLQLAAGHPEFSRHHYNMEMKFLQDGSRPVPKGAVL